LADDPQLLTDIRLTLGLHALRPIYYVGSTHERLPSQETTRGIDDFETIGGRDNLGQAIVIRLLTRRGELTVLGHPEYGSRLEDLIGQPNTETTRNLMKLYILEALQAEPRVAKVLAVEVAPVRFSLNQVVVTIRVQPTGKVPAVTVGPFTLEL
jgi:phage baseplate assembly protein W